MLVLICWYGIGNGDAYGMGTGSVDDVDHREMLMKRCLQSITVGLFIK